MHMNAIKAVKEIYTLEELKEIADHGCQSSVCTKHIYYGDTVQFYETHEAEIIPYLIDEYSVEFLVDLFKESLLGGDLTIYKNNVCWAFIEMVAMEAVEDHDFEYAQANADALAPVWFSHGGFNLLP